MSNTSSSPPSSPASRISTHASQIAALTATNTALQQQIVLLTNTKKRKSDEPYTRGRNYCKVVHMFTMPEPALAEHRSRTLQQPGAIPLRSKAQQREHDRLEETYQIFTRHFPIVKDLEGKPTVLAFFLEATARGSSQGKNDDLGQCRAVVGRAVNKIFNHQPQLDLDVRTGRGLQSDIIGKILTPISLDFDDLEVRARIRSFKEDISAKYNVRCLYKDFCGDPKKPYKGFLQSTLLFKVYIAIFFGPGAANEFDGENQPPKKKRKGGKGNVAAIAGLNGVVTARSLAYAAVMLHFNLQDRDQWSPTVNDFDYAEFYDYIVDALEAPPSDKAKKHVEELMKWWSKKVFTSRPKRTVPEDDSRALLEEQCNGDEADSDYDTFS